MATAPPLIRRTPITSSWLTSIGYDAESETLAIEFQNERVYHYPGVPVAVYDLIMGAPSFGKAYNEYVKGRYTGTIQPDAPRMGQCPKCGDLGLEGCTCEDCGTADYMKDAR